jgi:hypothetical protein
MARTAIAKNIINLLKMHITTPHRAKTHDLSKHDAQSYTLSAKQCFPAPPDVFKVLQIAAYMKQRPRGLCTLLTSQAQPCMRGLCGTHTSSSRMHTHRSRSTCPSNQGVTDKARLHHNITQATHTHKMDTTRLVCSQGPESHKTQHQQPGRRRSTPHPHSHANDVLKY